MELACNVGSRLLFIISISVLLNKWERLHDKIKENIQHTGVYGTLKTDVLSFKRDLISLLERTEEPVHVDEGEELEHRLHTFQVLVEISIFDCISDILNGNWSYRILFSLA